MAFGDGRVTVITAEIDPKVLKALSTIRGGEPISDGQF